MPTFDGSSAFWRDYKGLSESDQQRFLVAVNQFIDDLRRIEAGEQTEFTRGLRVDGLSGVPGVMEMTWAPDGRATFSWGDEVIDKKRHVRWRRCGTHAIFKRP